MKRLNVMTKVLFLVVAAFSVATATAQTVSVSSASAQGRALGAVFNAGSDAISSGLGVIGTAIKGAIGGSSGTPQAPASGSQVPVAVVVTAAPAPAPRASTDGSDEQYARVPRASFEAALDKAVAVLPEDRRLDVKGKAMADYDLRVARYNASNAQMNQALPLALESVNLALKSP